MAINLLANKKTMLDKCIAALQMHLFNARHYFLKKVIPIIRRFNPTATELGCKNCYCLSTAHYFTD